MALVLVVGVVVGLVVGWKLAVWAVSGSLLELERGIVDVERRAAALNQLLDDVVPLAHRVRS